MEVHMNEFGVEPMCRVLHIAPSTWHEHARRKADPDRLPERAKRDAELSVHIRRIFAENFSVYGVRKVWRQLTREGVVVARCTVARLMKAMGLQGVVRGKRIKTTVNDKATPCPLDKVDRQFAADRPNKLWVSDFTYVATWSASFMSRSSSTSTPEGSWAGGPAAPLRRGLRQGCLRRLLGPARSGRGSCGRPAICRCLGPAGPPQEPAARDRAARLRLCV